MQCSCVFFATIHKVCHVYVLANAELVFYFTDCLAWTDHSLMAMLLYVESMWLVFSKIWDMVVLRQQEKEDSFLACLLKVSFDINCCLYTLYPW